MSEVKVSIVIPFHNVQEYIETALTTIVNQTLKETEIICINDNSDDGSLDIVQRFAQNDGRFKIINLDSRQGQGFARNIGIDNATGKYIGFVDADDWINETMFEKLFNKAEETNADISMCKTILFDEKSQKEIFDGYYQLNSLNNFLDRSFSSYEIKDNLLNFNVAIWNKIYKTDFLKNLNIKFPSGYIYEDLPFFFETLLKSGNLSIVNENLYYYRINRPGSTMQNIGDKILNRIDMLKKALEHLQNCPFYHEIETQVLNWLIEDIFHRASLIDEEFFENYFYKAKEFLEELGFTSKDILRDKGVIFLDEVLFWLALEPKQALFFTRYLRSTDKKLDKLYSELSKSYDYINFKADEICKIVDVDKFSSKINEIKTASDNWSQYFNKEFKQLYDNISNQTDFFEENMNKLLYLQKDELTQESERKKSEFENRLKKEISNLDTKTEDRIFETVQKIQSEFEAEKRNLEEEFDKKLNEQRVKYERKIIKLEEDYNLFYKRLTPVIKFLRFFRIKEENKNGK